MTKMVWGSPGSRMYQAGVSHGVYFNQALEGQVWNGLISVIEGEDHGEDAPLYLDGRKVVNRKRFGDFIASIEVVAAPGEDAILLKNVFSFSYRVDFGSHYEIHLVYNARAVIEGRGYTSIADAADLTLLSLKISTLPQVVDFDRRTSHLVISSLVAREDALSMFESILYGNDDADSTLPTPDEVLEIFESHAILRVTDLRDGSYEISGPDEAIFENEDGSWTIDWPSVIQIHDSVYKISSL